MPTKQQKAKAEPFLEAAAIELRAAKDTQYSALTRAVWRERAAHQINKANQILKGKTNV